MCFVNPVWRRRLLAERSKCKNFAATRYMRHRRGKHQTQQMQRLYPLDSTWGMPLSCFALWLAKSGVYLVTDMFDASTKDYCSNAVFRCVGACFSKRDAADASLWGFTLPGVPFADLGRLSAIDAQPCSGGVTWGAHPVEGFGFFGSEFTGFRSLGLRGQGFGITFKLNP